MNTPQNQSSGYNFGTFQGVFTPSILTIIGVVMYLRFGWMLGNLGLGLSLFIVTIGSAITFLTGLSISALATNMRMKGGGAYFILSRSLGPEAGAALGIPLALSQAIGVSFYVAGFAEALVNSGLPLVSGWDPRAIGLVTLTVLAVVSTLNANIALKSQYFIMGAIALSLLSFFLGGTPTNLAELRPPTPPESIGFWPVFAVFFPAVTGILSGVGMSGDLKDPGKSIPRGTIAAVLVGYVLYMSVPLALHAMVPAPDVLKTDTMILQKCARWPWMILLGVWAATLSSAVGSFLCAPRVVQALSKDHLASGFLGRGYGSSDDPRVASALCFAIAAAGIWLGDINVIAPMLTLFNLSTYGLLNLSAACEGLMENPSWRPTFRIPAQAALSLVGFAGCLAAMFMISPGWTFVALFVEGTIFWIAKRREVRAPWDDMRAGLRMAIVRMNLRKLYRKRHRARNWRPNLLVFQPLPARNTHLMELAREVSGRRGLVTLAAIAKESSIPTGGERELVHELLAAAQSVSLECEAKVVAVDNPWAGMEELVRSYGFGPLVPNTVMMGFPTADNGVEFSHLAKLACRCRRNLVLVDAAARRPAEGFIDIWWRGKSPNASFMLALAFMMQRGEVWHSHPLRLNMIIRRQAGQDEERNLANFLEQARLTAQTRVVEAENVPFLETIAAHSGDSAATFVGLRTPSPDETPSDFGDYVLAMRQGLSAVSFPILALAAEDVRFMDIFN